MDRTRLEIDMKAFFISAMDLGIKVPIMENEAKRLMMDIATELRSIDTANRRPKFEFNTKFKDSLVEERVLDHGLPEAIAFSVFGAATYDVVKAVVLKHCAAKGFKKVSVTPVENRHGSTDYMIVVGDDNYEE